MAVYQRPDVYVNEVLTALNTSSAPTSDAAGAFVDSANRGPLVPTLVTSWSTYTALFGDFTNSTALADALFLHFTNGGGPAWVCRVAAASAVKATRTLQDTAGTPQPTLQVDAANPGAWGNAITVDVVAGYTSGRFDLVVHLGTRTESFTDLSMTTTDSRYAPDIVNAGSQLVVVTDLLSATAAPNNLPATQAGTSLATGADGSAPASADYTAAVNLLANIAQPLVLNLPGVTDATTLNNAISFADGRKNVFLVTNPPKGQTPDQAKTWAATLTTSSNVSAYYPWVKVNDPTKVSSSVKKTVAPGGAVVGQFIATDSRVGPFKTPAGTDARLAGVVDLETTLQPSDYDSLNTATPPLNAIRPIPGFGICVFGGRTLKGSYSDKFVAVRRSLIYIEQSLTNLTRFAVFQPNDDKLWSSLTATCEKFLNAYYGRGGLRGDTATQAFYVKCDAENNTLADIQAGVVNIEVGVSVQYPAEFVVINIGQFEGGTSVTNSLAA